MSLNQIDDDIMAGRLSLARDKLQKMYKAGVLSTDREKFASLSWRSGLPNLGILCLNPVIRPGHSKALQGTTQEKTVYGCCLVKIGAINEALEILGPIEIPDAFLFKAFAHVAKWDYRSSIALLQKYLSSPNLSRYQTLVGKVNLAAALVYEKDEGARSILEELNAETDRPETSLLNGHVLQVEAHRALSHFDFDRATQILKIAESRMSEAGGLASFFIDKWKVVKAVLETSGSPASLKSLREFRFLAARKRHWETLRDCDFYEIVAKKSEALALKLYFGTPYENYRQRIVSQMGGKLKIPQEFVWKLGEGGVKAGEVLNLKSPVSLTPGELVHRVLTHLSSDFYRPLRLASLHALLYPKEHFNPLSSPNRVYRAIKRTRDWLKSEKFPIAIEEEAGAYFLQSSGPAAVRVALSTAGEDRKTYFLEDLRNKLPDSEFSVAEVSAMSGLPSWTVLRIFQSGISNGVLYRSGKAASTKYGFVSSKSRQNKAA